MSETHYSLEAQSLDWLIVITNLLNRYNDKKDPIAVGISSEGDSTTFSIPRKAIPPEAVAKALGTTVENVTATKGKIVLKPFKAMADWPTPTVEEYGNA